MRVVDVVATSHDHVQVELLRERHEARQARLQAVDRAVDDRGPPHLDQIGELVPGVVGVVEREVVLEHERVAAHLAEDLHPHRRARQLLFEERVRRLLPAAQVAEHVLVRHRDAEPIGVDRPAHRHHVRVAGCHRLPRGERGARQGAVQSAV